MFRETFWKTFPGSGPGSCDAVLDGLGGEAVAGGELSGCESGPDLADEELPVEVA